MGNEFLASRQKPQASGAALPRKRLEIDYLHANSVQSLNWGLLGFQIEKGNDLEKIAASFLLRGPDFSCNPCKIGLSPWKRPQVSSDLTCGCCG